MKKSAVGILFVISILFAVSIVFVSSLSCDIRLRSACDQPEKVVMGVSGTTNAHGEFDEITIQDSGVYDYVLCCDTSGSTQCTTNNKIIGLSSASNAHAEIPENTLYSTEVCWGDLECVSSNTDACGSGAISDYDVNVLSLSGDTNAHIGGPGDYSYNICCKSPTTPNAFWSFDGTNQIISSIDVSPGSTKVNAVLENPTVQVGGDVVFEIYERDLFFDDLIKTVSVTVTESSIVSYEWTISQIDLDAGKEAEAYEDLEFYFVIYDASDMNAPITESNDPDLTINQIISAEECIGAVFSCGDYTQEQCNLNDVCGVADNNPGTDISCSDPTINCFCEWGANPNDDPLICNDVYTVLGLREYCGDSNIDSYDSFNEVCDPDDGTPVFLTGISTCSDLGPLEGTLSCSNACLYTGCENPNPPVCGDGIVNAPGEECDGYNNLNGWSCSALGYEDTAGLTCDSNCKLVTSGCTPGAGSYCGDGTVDTPNSGGLPEQCDSTTIPGSCTDGNYYTGGDLSCTSYCRYDYSTCTGADPICGNNLVDNPTEECDGTDLGVYSCEKLGFREGEGSLACDSNNCKIDTLSCLIPEATTVLGQCIISSESSDPDGCGDGFITYSWTAIWSEGPNDPNRPDTCVDGEQTLQCPAQIQLPFFGFYNFVATALAIALIYFVFGLKKRKKN